MQTKTQIATIKMGNRVPTSNNDLRENTVAIKRNVEETPSDNEEAAISNIEEQNLDTPKKKKLKSTSRYIYDTLFINGENSDVMIVAFGKEWKLHKVYLCQASYFASMFSGSWKESQENIIKMDIPDENIDLEALKISFGSLYSDEVLISATRVISVLACATLLGLDGLIQQCICVMQETVSSKTVCSYHTAAYIYGQIAMKAECEQWLHHNLMYKATPQLLAEISCSLMEKVVKSPKLLVMQVEMDIYSMLKRWTYLRITNNKESTNSRELSLNSEIFWKSRLATSDGAELKRNDFLLTEEGKPFQTVFKALRLPHIINDFASAKILESDSILPIEWVMPIYRQQWLQMIRVEQGLDKGPSNIVPNFDEVAMRCGRTIENDGNYCWRWTGYNFGVDLLVSYSNKLILFKRNAQSQSCPGGVSLLDTRHVLYRLTVSSLNALGHPRYFKSTDVKHMELRKDEECVIMGIDRNMPYPLHINCQFLQFTPRAKFLTNPALPPT